MACGLRTGPPMCKGDLRQRGGRICPWLGKVISRGECWVVVSYATYGWVWVEAQS
jgi:hypothetical protein